MREREKHRTLGECRRDLSGYVKSPMTHFLPATCFLTFPHGTHDGLRRQAASPPASPGGPAERSEAQRTSGSSRGLTAPSIPRAASHPPWLLSQTQSHGGCSAGIPRPWRKAGPGPRSLLWTSSPRLTAALAGLEGDEPEEAPAGTPGPDFPPAHAPPDSGCCVCVKGSLTGLITSSQSRRPSLGEEGRTSGLGVPGARAPGP